VARLDPADVRGGSFDHRQRVAHLPLVCGRAGHAFVDREDATPVVFRSVARVGSVKPAPARSRRTRRSERSVRRVDLAARAGSCTDASFSAVFRYPPLGPSRPGRTKVLPSGSLTRRISRPSRAVASSGGAPGVLPFAGLIPQSGGHAARAPRLNELATFLSDRAHVPFVPAHPSRLIFVGMIGRRLGTSARKRRSTGDELASTSGLGSRLRSDAPAHLRPGNRSCLGLCLLQG